MTALGTLIDTFDTEWVGVLHEQIPHFMRGYVDETIRNRQLLANLRKAGRIKVGAKGSQCIWNVKFSQQPISSAADGGTLSFQRHDLQRQAALNWRGYVGTDTLTEKEYLMNSGPGAILNRYSETIPSLMEALTDHFGGEMYLDGNATGRENNIHGIESFTATGLTAVANDMVVTPSDSYAGNNTDLGDQGGSWSANLGSTARPCSQASVDWPSGTGSVKYDYYAPLLVNWASTRWGTSSAAWEDNCERVLRQSIIWQRNRCGPGAQPKLAMMDQALYAGFLNHQASKGRILIEARDQIDLGFPGTYSFDGVALNHDYDCPVNTGYLVSTDTIDLMSLDKVLFGSKGPTFWMPQRAYLFYAGFWGNARYRPKHICKFYAYSTPG